MTERATAVASGPPAAVPREEVPPFERLIAFACENGLLSLDLADPTVERPPQAARVSSHPFHSTDVVPLTTIDPIDVLDTQLDDYQRDAVARALATPDLFILDGLSGTGKTRATVELVRQTTRQGRRVLLMSPSSRELDCVIGQLAAVGERTLNLATDNSHDRIAAEIIDRATSFEVVAIERVRENESLLPLWDELASVIDERDRLNSVRAAMSVASPSVDLENGCPDFRRLLGELEERSDQRRRQLQVELLTARNESEGIQPKLAEAEATRDQLRISASDHSLRGRWRKLLCRLQSTPAESSMQEVDAAVGRLRSALEAAAERTAALELAIARFEADVAVERKRLISVEAARQKALVDTRLVAIDGRCAELATKLPECHFPEALTPGTVRSARENWARDAEQRASVAADASAWKHWTQKNRRALTARWISRRPVVAVTHSVLKEHQGLLDRPFDLGILVAAEQASEPQMTSSALLAERWALVGDSHLHAHDDFFARECDRLRLEPWTRESDRLTFRLLSLSSAERKHLEIEPVADRPEIELRIGSRDGEFVLAEVAFPPNTSPGLAREFLYRELSIIPCQPRTRCGRWIETDGGLVFHLHSGGEIPVPPRFCELADGVGLHMADLSGEHRGENYAFAFGPEWNRETAEGWLVHNVWKGDSGRVCRLIQNHRQSPELAGWVAAALSGASICPAPGGGCVVLEPVPRRWVNRSRPGGAGYEINLGNVEQREVLSPELAARLPNAGFVNLAEAKAIADLARRWPTDRAILATAPDNSQVEVLREFLPRSVRVLTAADASEAECDWLIISLTRSHLTRAVTFSVDVNLLPRLMARPRHRLIFVGDPGTLARRAGWRGAVDHFGRSEGEYERTWVAALLGLAPVQSPRPERVKA